jgi:hypothetical protein
MLYAYVGGSTCQLMLAEPAKPLFIKRFTRSTT